jgi:uncharacterized DUF497 family protein
MSNISKHGVSFEEAWTVFNDYDALIASDPEHSEDEDRFIIIGISEQLKLLTVCHCCRENDAIRIISARRATKNEAKQYSKGG